MKRAVIAVVLAAGLLAGVATLARAEKGCADVNKDTVVNSVDAVLVLQVDAGLYDLGFILLNAWDPFDDDAINSRDALLILQRDAGLIGELTSCYA